MEGEAPGGSAGLPRCRFLASVNEKSFSFWDLIPGMCFFTVIKVEICSLLWSKRSYNVFA